MGTRFWELALGGVCVFILKFLENSSSLLLDFIKRFSTQLVWLFFLGIWVFIVILPINAILPGLWVIIPDICVASILVIGNFDSNKANRLTFTNIFKARFIQLLGDMSYSTYIWHWVLIIMVQRIFPINFDLQFKLFLILVIYFVSFLSYRLIEQNFNKMSTSITHPFYKSPIIKIYLVGVVILVLVIPFSLYKLELNGNEIAQSVQLAKNASINDECFGAKSFTDSNCELKFNAIDSKYLFSYKDDAFNLIYPECSKPLTDNFCKFGSDDAAKKVLVWGDSHSAHYISLFEEWSKQADVQFTIAIRVGCTHTLKQPVNFHFEDFERREGGSGCVDFNQKVLNDYAPKMDAVIMSSGYAIYTTTNYQEIIEGYTIDAANEHSVNYLENANDELIENVKEILNSKQLEKARNNKHLYILQDTPWTNQSIPYCYTTNFSKCRIQEEVAHVSDFIKQAVDETLNAQFVETANNFCLEKVCYFRIGGTPVYSDYDHLTTSFARSMLGDFKKKISLD